MKRLSGYVHVCCLLHNDHDYQGHKNRRLVFELPTEQLFLSYLSETDIIVHNGIS